MKSALTFTIIKFIGADYLIYLGFKMLLDRRDTNFTLTMRETNWKQSYLQGMLTNVLNSKVALFFLAFLPQFVVYHNQNIASQMIMLGMIFILSGTIVNDVVAYSFGVMKHRLVISSSF